MKGLLLVIVLSVVGCASGSKKAKQEVAKKAEPTKAQAKEVAKAEVKKEMDKKPEAKKWSSFVTCTFGENERTIKNEMPEAGGCEVLYTKDTVEDSVADAKNDMEFCQKIVDRIANKLVAAGFDCKDNK